MEDLIHEHLEKTADGAKIWAWKKSIPRQKRAILKLFRKKCSFEEGKSKKTDAKWVPNRLQDLHANFDTALEPFGTRIAPKSGRRNYSEETNSPIWLKSSLAFSWKSDILMGKVEETDARWVPKVLKDLHANFGTALEPFATRIAPIKLKK